MLFSRRTPNYCWICGSTEQLSGEHKIKKSNLQRHPMMKPSFMRVATGRDQPIQGLNSKLLKFENAICARCNNQTSQKADRSYDEFRNEDSTIVRTTLEDLESMQSHTKEHEVKLSHRVELARYFGKHLGCALHYQKFPIPRRLSRFVDRRSDAICISVSTRVAPFWWQEESGKIGPLNALGGAIMLLSIRPLHLPIAYQSAYMTDGVQFIVKMRLSVPEALEMRILYQRKMGRIINRFSDEDAKLRGLPFDE